MTEEQLQSDLKQIEERLTELRRYSWNLETIIKDTEALKAQAIKAIGNLMTEQDRLQKVRGSFFYKLQKPDLSGLMPEKEFTPDTDPLPGVPEGIGL